MAQQVRSAGADQIAVTASLRRKKASSPSTAAKIDAVQQNAYLMLTITPIVMVALTAVVVLCGKPCHRTGCSSGISVHHCGIHTVKLM